jgi:hypothetical protein
VRLLANEKITLGSWDGITTNITRGVTTALGRGKTQPDSLIVIAKGGHSSCLHGSCVSSCQVTSLARCILIQISVTPSNMGDAYSLLSFHRSVISLCSYEIYGSVTLCKHSTHAMYILAYLSTRYLVWMGLK